MAEARFFYRDPDAPRPNRPNHIGVVVLIEYNGAYLMEHRTDSETWAFIGGGLEVDETLCACALREVKEETGIVLEKENLRYVKLYDDPSRIIAYADGNVYRSITVLYHTRLESLPALVCSEESRELRFFTKEEIPAFPVAKTHSMIVWELP